ncbi:MAG TPA: phosphatidate cytidylyltransferase [Solirubrobacteraceae bacterium]|jgi:phosphatidate cytidylyltransferase|nr:phosphatidate cytidylyltransferase [Solirubrobacteraceae bacterium]
MADEPPRRRRREDGRGGQPPPRRAANERRREAAARRDQVRESRQRRPAPRGQRRRPRSELVSRVLVAIPAAVIAVVFVDLGGTPWAALMILLGWACLDELYRMLHRWKPATSAGLAALAGMVLAARFGSQFQVLLILVTAVPVVFFLVLMRRERVNATISIAGTLLGIYWLGLAFAHAVLLRQLPHGGAILIDILVGTFLGDTAAYLGGRAFGRRPLAPSISPHKTVEGLLCGMLIAVVAVLIAGTFQTVWLTTQHALLIGVGVAIAGPVGDLFESLIKRDAGAKDTGTLFGAHGGALDRLDGAIFTVVVGYYIWAALS